LDDDEFIPPPPPPLPPVFDDLDDFELPPPPPPLPPVFDDFELPPPPPSPSISESDEDAYITPPCFRGDDDADEDEDDDMPPPPPSPQGSGDNDTDEDEAEDTPPPPPMSDEDETSLAPPHFSDGDDHDDRISKHSSFASIATPLSQRSRTSNDSEESSESVRSSSTRSLSIATDGGSDDGATVLSADSISSMLGVVEDVLVAAEIPILFDRVAATRQLLADHKLSIALEAWSFKARVSSINMEALYKILHALLGPAVVEANLPLTHATTTRLLAKAEKIFRGDAKGFVRVDVPITDPELTAKHITNVAVYRRSIKETATKICQNPRNRPGTLRTRGVFTPGEFGDVMNSPGLHRIQSLTDIMWDKLGIPEDERMTLYVSQSRDGTSINRGNSMPVEASTMITPNIAPDERNNKGNIKLLSVYRSPSLHNPTVASQRKAKYHPTAGEHQALWCVFEGFCRAIEFN
jgi:hypothetical protein